MNNLLIRKEGKLRNKDVFAVIPEVISTDIRCKRKMRVFSMDRRTDGLSHERKQGQGQA